MNPELVDATTLDGLADRLGMRGLLPHLVRRLLGATPGVTGLVMPAEEGVGAPGFDAVVDGGAGTAWVPAAASVWEMGTDKDPKRKAQKEYDKRTADPLTATSQDTAFVFVTPRRWAAGQDWAKDRREEGTWRDVLVLDAEGLHGWLEATPDVHIWLSERLGSQPLSVRTLSRVFEMLSARTRPALPPGLLLAGRDEQVHALRAALAGPPAVVAVRGSSREEAMAFMAAALGVADIDGDQAPDQPLWVRDALAFERLALSDRPMNLVVTIDGVEVGDAVSRGHRVLLALGGGDYDRSGVIALPRPARALAQDALRAAGLSFERADRLAALARLSFAALLREMSVTQAGSRPGWATGADAPLLVALLLLGGWAGTDGDDEVILSVSGRTRAEAELRLAALSAGDDPPWTRSGGAWRPVSPDDGFALLGELLESELLERWRVAGVRVLSEIDPRLGMDQSERLLADVREDARPRFSGALRRGIAEAAALLGGRGGEALSSGTVPAHHAARLVRDIMTAANSDASGKLWGSLSRLLPLLAEASPDEFLDAVEDSLAVDPSPLLSLFQDGPGFSPMFSHSPHTGLLRALEAAAWSPDHLLRATLLLGELAAREPGGRLVNRPSASLRAIFLSWLPYTGADLAGRLAAIDALRARWPDVAWSLLLALLPRFHDTGSPTRQPRFRDWAPERGRTAPDELIHTIHALAVRVAEDAGSDPRRWSELVEHLYMLPPSDREMLLGRLRALEPGEMRPEDRLALWRALFDEGQRHLAFPDAKWSLERGAAEELIAAAELFADEDMPERHARLFDSRVRLPEIARDDYEAQERELSAVRESAAADVLASHGVDGLKRLAQAVRLPRAIGWAAAVTGDELASDLLPLLGGDGPDSMVAAGWSARRAADGGVEWARQQLAVGVDLSVRAQAVLMLALPHSDASWDLLETLGPEVEAEYWRAARPFVLPRALLSRAVHRLLQYGRPWAAVDLLAGVTHGGGALDPEVTENVLKEAAGSDEIDAAIHAAWEVGQLLDAAEAAGLPDDRLASLEFSFFALLDDVREPRALTAAVARDAQLFVDLVRHVYQRADGKPEPDVRAELTSHAWQVLHDLRSIPGADGEGRIDPDALDRWVTEAREKLAAVDRAEIGDSVLGELLARGGPGADGVWPAEPVRDLVEQVRSGPLEEGLLTGKLNQRGVTTRGPYDGGAQERALANALREDIRGVQAKWPRTARILREMAVSYEAESRQHDREAERRSDDA